MDKYQKFLVVVKKHHPNLKEDQVRVFGDGWDRVAILVDKIVYSFPRYKGAEEVLPATVKFTQEFSLASPIKIPVMSLHQNSLIYASYEFIEGIPLSKEFFATLSKEKQLEIATRLGEFLYTVHIFPKDEALKLGIKDTGPYVLDPEEMDKVKQRVYPEIEAYEREWINALFKDYLSLVKSNPPKLSVIHSDMQPEHIIVDPKNGKLAGVIDFGDVEINDTAYDFWLLDWYYGKDFSRELYKAYGLEKDKDWDLRIKYYKELKLVRQLNHSLAVKDRERIKKHKQRLQEYIRNSRLESPSDYLK